MKNLILLYLVFFLSQSFLFAQGIWNQQISGSSYNLVDAYFLTDNLGWAVGGDFSTNVILNTTNGGINWNPQIGNVNNCLNSIYFLNDINGWTIGTQGTILSTTNGGQNWNNNSIGAQDYLSIYFIDDTTGWIVGDQGIILKTPDGGLHWNIQTSGSTNKLSSIYFVDKNTGWTVGDNGVVLNTNDGGENWLPQNSKTNNNLNCIYFLNQNFGWIGTRGAIITTTDGGSNWTLNGTPGVTTTSIYFVDKINGWVTTNSNFGYSGMIQFSTNGGKNWVPQLNNVKQLWSIKFTETNRGWAVGDSGAIYHTTNGGLTFVEEQIAGQNICNFELTNCYPNPFNPSTTIKYSIPKLSFVTIKIYDVLGSEVATLVNEEKPTGNYELTWNAANLSSGVYLYKLTSAGFVQTKKMILLK
jgi:photosystem II stability/assembly factor-like uncharacterized protein